MPASGFLNRRSEVRVLSGPPETNFILDAIEFLRRFVPLLRQVGHSKFIVWSHPLPTPPLGKRAVSKLPVLRSLRIDINLSEALMSGYGLYLMRRRALFSHLRRRRFAETVRLAMAEIGLIAPISYGVAKAGGRVRLAVLGHQERKVTRFRRLNAFLEFGIQRNVNFNWLPVLILGLGKLDAAISRVLRAESHGIFATASSEA
jgi:hypothetical protein